MILSNGRNTFKIPGKNLKFNFKLALDRSTSGAGSDSVIVNNGTKPHVITVSGTIPYSDAEALSQLADAVRALDGDLAPVKYEIADRTCAALKIRAGCFTSSLDVSEAGSLQAWNYSFELTEQMTVPEKQQQRAIEKAETGTPVTQGGKVVGSVKET